MRTSLQKVRINDMVFLDLPGWAWLLIFIGVWIVLSVLEFFEPCFKAARDAAIAEAMHDKRQFYAIDDTEPMRRIEYKFDGVWYAADVHIITQVEPGVIAFDDTDGRSFLVHTDEWREVNIPVGVGMKNDADE